MIISYMVKMLLSPRPNSYDRQLLFNFTVISSFIWKKPTQITYGLALKYKDLFKLWWDSPRDYNNKTLLHLLGLFPHRILPKKKSQYIIA